ncbi:MAG: phosphate signaling complex protein PhoU [Bacteroidales bacterium]|nr:phosphate signaling complex protein PhoU [Bacteroidales bacterium]
MLPQEQASKMIRDNTVKMWMITSVQIEKAQKYMHNKEDVKLKELKKNEKYIDSYELKLYFDCENFLALFSPVAIDLRFVLSTLHISYDLERIGDMARKIVQTLKTCTTLTEDMIALFEIDRMFDVCSDSLEKVLNAYETINSDIARQVLVQDAILNEINKLATSRAVTAIQKNPQDAEIYLNLTSVTRRLERLGDHIKNIAEEIIFYVEADVLKHKKSRDFLEDNLL